MSDPLFEINEVVGFVGMFDHCFGRVIMARLDNGKWDYLLEESPHRIGGDGGGWMMVANATLYGMNDEGGRTMIGPGITMTAGWNPERDLKKRDPATVCQCQFCKKRKRRQPNENR